MSDMDASPVTVGITVKEYLETQYTAFRLERRRAQHAAQFAAQHTETLADFLAQFRTPTVYIPLPIVEEPAPRKLKRAGGELRGYRNFPPLVGTGEDE